METRKSTSVSFVLAVPSSLNTINSVTKLLDYLFNFWSFTTKKICPKSRKFCQSYQKILPQYYINPKTKTKYF